MDIEYYKSLVPTENSKKPKFMAFLEAILKNAIDTSIALESMKMAFAVDNAAGKQLDILGEWVGVSRILPMTPSVGNREMNDEEYRLMILMKIAKNNWDGTNEGATAIYDSVFTGSYHVYHKDNQNMTVYVTLFGVTTAREAEILTASDVLLIPAGVNKLVRVVASNVNMSAWAATNIAGIEFIETVDMLVGDELYVADIEDRTVNWVQNHKVWKLQ